MLTRKVLILLVFVIAFVLGGCSNPFGPDDSSDDDGVEETYDVTFEVTSENLPRMGVDWRMGDDEGAGVEEGSSWEKEGTCGEDEELFIYAGNDVDDIPSNSSITATIYIDGEKEVTATGNWDSVTEDTAVSVSTRTPDPD